MRVLILGGGQVATAVAAAQRGSHQVLTRTRSVLDIVDRAAVLRTFQELKPDWVVNAAAFTAVDLAEDQSAQAHAVNDGAVAGLAAAASKTGCRLLHLSTDFVFDGKSSRAYVPDDVPSPLSVYGASKLAGERHVALRRGTPTVGTGAGAGAGAAPGTSAAPGTGAASSRGIVLRTSWVYAVSGKNFVLTMLRLMREKPQLSVVCDQIGSPTWAMSIGRCVWGLIDADAAPGIYHWTDLGVASWYDFAVAIQDEARQLGLLANSIPITPISSSEYPARAARPAFSVLDTAATRAAIGLPGDHWRHHLRAMLNELRAH